MADDIPKLLPKGGSGKEMQTLRKRNDPDEIGEGKMGLLQTIETNLPEDGDLLPRPRGGVMPKLVM